MLSRLRAVVRRAYRPYPDRPLQADDPGFSPGTFTRQDRYPEIFRWASAASPSTPDHRVLSFGCSVGKEVFTLRRYFPLSHILGVDIDARNIARARSALKKSGDPRIAFERCGVEFRPPAAQFDVVFCMSVLKNNKLRRSGVEDCSATLPFSKFETAVTALAHGIKPGGLLVIQNCNFRFLDTAASAVFEPVLSLPARTREDTAPVFGRDNKIVPGYFAEKAYRRRKA